jgi:hypothetical protein
LLTVAKRDKCPMNDPSFEIVIKIIEKGFGIKTVIDHKFFHPWIFREYVFPLMTNGLNLSDLISGWTMVILSFPVHSKVSAIEIVPAFDCPWPDEFCSRLSTIAFHRQNMSLWFYVMNRQRLRDFGTNVHSLIRVKIKLSSEVISKFWKQICRSSGKCCFFLPGNVENLMSLCVCFLG